MVGGRVLLFPKLGAWDNNMGINAAWAALRMREK